MKKQLILPERKGWPVRVSGDTMNTLKWIQAQQIGVPSYTSIVDQAVADLARSMRPGK